jgi:hypothetical protein
MITGYEAFSLFQSLKLHFNSDSYDFFKYNGKSRISIDAFENRKDKFHFYKLSRRLTNRDELIMFIVANFLHNENIWVGDLLTEESETIYRQRQKVLQSFSYIFENDCRKLFDGVDNPNDFLKVTNGEYPVLMTKTLQKDIEIETLCVLNTILKFMPNWNNKITDTIRWPLFYRKVLKFSEFLPKDVTRFKMILKKVIEEGRECSVGQ